MRNSPIDPGWGREEDGDMTTEQIRNLSADRKAVWAEDDQQRDENGHRGHWSTFGTYWCDTCDSPYCELA